ncbi:MAG: clostripain-related cysteine peptidase [Thermoplasmata archaeon]|nr:clostripain-related cysteine peptidase [Thermoplasmata archaeon]
MKIQPNFSFLLVLLLLMPGIPVHGSPQTAEKDGRSIQASDWLFLVYMDADNNLAAAADNNLAQMMAAGSDADINILVLLDKNGIGDSQIYNVKKNGLEVVDDGGAVIPDTREVNMGSPDTLRNFLNFSTRFQRNHTFLVLWDHGSGWKGFCTDSQSRDSLNLSEIAEATSGFGIDVLGIDACQGALMEVVYALRNSAKYFVGSQKDEPENGWNYSLLLNMARSTAPLTPERFATIAVEAFEKHYRTHSFLSVSVALSAINLSKVETLANAVDNFSLALLACTFLLHAEISEARNSTETYEGNNRGDIDLGDFARKSQNISYIQIRKSAREVVSSLQSAVLRFCGITAFLPASGVRADNVSGLSIYFPQSSFNSEYLKTTFTNERNWSRFLLDFLNPPSLQPVALALTTKFENTTISIENPGNATVYICDSTGEAVKTTSLTWINYTVPVCDYYEILAYNYTSYGGKFYLDGIFKSERKWVGEVKPNIKIASVEFFREDGVRILGDTGKHPVENRTFTVRIEIANSGNVNVSTLAIIEIGNLSRRENLTVDVNNTTRLDLQLSLASGEFKFLVFLDPANNLRETNETDNVYTEKCRVKTKIPARGITITLNNPGVCEYRIYNGTGILLAEGRIIGRTKTYIGPSDFTEGEYLYVHIISGNHSYFRKIQIFSEDENYELSFNIQTDGFTVIDYVFVASVIGLTGIIAFTFGYVIWRLRKSSR